MVDLTALRTEARNEHTLDLDTLSVTELLTRMNAEDRRVPESVASAIPQVAQAVDLVATALGAGGRLIYLGAGTSGRLGVLDAVECPPTFGTDPSQVIGLIAGGERAQTHALEGAEDDPDLAASQLNAIGLTDRDVVVGISASGRTPYVIGGLDHARRLGAKTVGIVCNTHAQISQHADVAIEVDTGPEVLTGSTRLKAGTSQKLVLNMISTAAMVQIGKVYGNLMVDVRPTNDKLRRRAQHIVEEATDCESDAARAALSAADGQAKTAIVMLLLDVDAPTARERLAAAQGRVRDAIDSRTSGSPRR